MKRMLLKSLLFSLFQIGWTNSSRRSYFYIFKFIKTFFYIFHDLPPHFFHPYFKPWNPVTSFGNKFQSVTRFFGIKISLISFHEWITSRLSSSLTLEFFSLSLSLSENLFLLNLCSPNEIPSHRDTNFQNTFVLSHFRLNLVDKRCKKERMQKGRDAKGKGCKKEGMQKGRDLFKTLVPMFQMRHVNPSDAFDFSSLFWASEIRKRERERESSENWGQNRVPVIEKERTQSGPFSTYFGKEKKSIFMSMTLMLTLLDENMY